MAARPASLTPATRRTPPSSAPTAASEPMSARSTNQATSSQATPATTITPQYRADSRSSTGPVSRRAVRPPPSMASSDGRARHAVMPLLAVGMILPRGRRTRPRAYVPVPGLRRGRWGRLRRSARWTGGRVGWFGIALVMGRAWPRPDGAGTGERPDRPPVPGIGVVPRPDSGCRHAWLRNARAGGRPGGSGAGGRGAALLRADVPLRGVGPARGADRLQPGAVPRPQRPV